MENGYKERYIKSNILRLMEIRKIDIEEYCDYEDGENSEESWDEGEVEFLNKWKPTKEDIENEFQRVNIQILESGKIDRLMEKIDTYQTPFREYCKMKCDIQKVDALWKGSSFYIDREMKTAKYVNSRRDLWKGRVKEPPIIEWRDGWIEIVKGRHRFANLRDMGYKEIWILFHERDETKLLEMNIL